jgi:hypothetical protein
MDIGIIYSINIEAILCNVASLFLGMMKDTLIAGPLPATVLALMLKEYSVEGFKSHTSLKVYSSSV